VQENTVGTPQDKREMLNETDARPLCLRIVESVSRDVYLNLALEQQLYADLLSEEVVLFLWRNDPCVVIGRHQNPWRECELEGMAEQGVRLARRASGGGAVYHDAGNGNFTFIAHSAFYHQQLHFKVIISALADHGVTAHRSGRNDILVGDRKISGNAFRHQKQKSYHHGTLLLSTDLDRLTRYLNPECTSVKQSSGIESVRSTVVNLDELQPGIQWRDLVESLVRNAQRAYGCSVSRTSVDEAQLAACGQISRRQRMYQDWRWVYGRTPDFARVHRLPDPLNPSGLTDVELTVKRGVIVEPAPFTGFRYRPEDLMQQSRECPGTECAMFTSLAGQLSATAGFEIGDKPID
jgi:lipoate---protein ligase